MKPTPAQSHKYFQLRFGKDLPYRDKVLLHCPFHDDRHESFSVNLRDGVWKCWAGCGQGGLIDFEMKHSKCDRNVARQNLNEILQTNVFALAEQPEAVYQYRDEQGIILFEKLRFPGKRFTHRRWTGSKYEYTLEGIRKLLYNLPEVITAAEVFVCEGEKDADNVLAAMRELQAEAVRVGRIASTTNFAGASNWSSDYNKYFAGKKVVVFPDNDSIGLAHAERVASEISEFAYGVKVVKLPGLPEHGDVSDYLKSHTADDLLREVKAAPKWYPVKPEQKLFVPVLTFLKNVPDDLNWLVEGVIEKNANGLIAAVPKAGKSWTGVDLAIALALGEPWLGFTVPHPIRVALISREDNPALTAWRLKALWQGRRARMPWLFETNLYVNTRAQSQELMFDDPEQMAELTAAMKTFGPEFAIFDVFNVLHRADENDNSEMRAVLQKLSKLQADIGCACCVIHHYKKGEGSMTERLRGASAIAGWVEWLVGISLSDPEKKTRKAEFELKAAMPPDPVFYRIESEKYETGEIARLELETYEEKKPQQRVLNAAELAIA